MLLSLTALQIFFLVSCSFFAGLIDSIAGGGGLITVPALLVVGIPPHLALGTNKLQSSFGSFTASFHYTRKQLVSPRTLHLGIITTFIGASLGTLCVQFLPSDFLAYIMPVLLVLIFVFMLLSPRAGIENKKEKIPTLIFFTSFGLGLGFYDGFFGPGTGSFWAMSLVFFLGMNLKTATAHTKIFNFVSNIASLLFFILGGHVLFLLGCLMGLGQVLGASIGAQLVIRRHAGFVKTIFLIVVGITLIKLLWSTFFGASYFN